MYITQELLDSRLTDFEMDRFFIKIFHQDYEIEMQEKGGFQFYTLTSKDIIIKSIGYVIDKIIIKGRELSQNTILAISRDSSSELKWIIEKWYNNNKLKKEIQKQEQMIEENNFLRQYINESEE